MLDGPALALSRRRAENVGLHTSSLDYIVVCRRAKWTWAWGRHCFSHSRRQATKPEFGFMHARWYRLPDADVLALRLVAAHLADLDRVNGPRPQVDAHGRALRLRGPTRAFRRRTPSAIARLRPRWAQPVGPRGRRQRRMLRRGQAIRLPDLHLRPPAAPPRRRCETRAHAR
jgi:hypothetical protein